MSKTRMGKRVASLLLSLVMMLSLLPTTVYATGDTGDTTDEIVGQATTSGDNTEGTGGPEPTGEGEDGSANVTEGEDGAATNDAVVEETIAPVNAEGVDAVANAESSGDEVSRESGGTANVNEGETVTVATIGEAKYETLNAAIEAVPDGQTIVVNAGEYKLPGSQTLYAGKAFTIKAADGATVSFDMTDAVTLGSAKVTFENVTFDYKSNSDYKGLQHATTLVYNNCTINGEVTLYAANETFNGCTFNAKLTTEGKAQYNVWTYGAQNVAFNGCTFECKGKTVNAYQEGGNTGGIAQTIVVKNCTVNSTAADKAFLNIKNTQRAYDVVFEGKNTVTGLNVDETTGSALFQVETTTVTETSGNPVTVSTKDADGAVTTIYAVKAEETSNAVAKIGETEYETLADAIAAAQDGDTVTLLRDCSGNGIVVKKDTFTGKGLTVDFAGHTYTVGGVLVGSSGTMSNGFQLNKNNKITFQNGAIYGDASVAGDDTTSWSGAPAILIQNYCDLTLSGMKVSGGSNTVYTMSNNCGNVVIENTTINAGRGSLNRAPFALDACGYSDYTGVSVTVKGTSAINGDIEVSRSAKNKNAVTLTLESGTVNGKLKIDSSIKSGDATTVTKSNAVNVAAPAGYVWDNGTLAAAVAKIGETTYATLQAAIDAAKDGDTVTLLADVDLGSSKIGFYKTGCENLTFDLNGHKITSAIQNNGTVVASRVGLVIKNGTIENTCTDKAKAKTSAVYVTSGGTTTLENVTLHSNYSGLYVCQLSNAVTVVVNVEKDTVINGGMYGVNLDAPKGTATTAPGVTLNVNGGTITGTEYGIHANSPSSGKYGTINANITAGTVGGVCVVSNNANQPVKLDITGGTINGKLYNPISTNGASSTVTISGGTFTTKPNETYLADGYVFAANGDGTYGVVEAATAVAQIGETTYGTLAEAIAAAKSGATVKLLANTKENVTIDKGLTLDLNGFTLNGSTGERKPALTITARTVTIKDSSEAQTGTIMREDTAENSGVSSHYVIDIQGNAWVMFESGNVKNGSGAGGTKGASLVRVGDDSVAKYPGLNIKGGTFTQDNFIVIKVDSGDLFLNGGTLSSKNSYAIENWHRATIKGGTVNGTVAAWTYSGGHNSDLEIIGGTVNGNVESVSYDGAEGKLAKVKITGGVVNGMLSTHIYNKETEPSKDIATIEVTGGTFKEDPTKYLVECSTVTPNADGTFGVAKAYLAKVGNTSYYTMDEAFKAQTNGDTIVLLRDYTTGGTFNSGSINRTVDLNDHTWTCTGTDANSAAFEINYPNASLTVKNGKIVSSQLVGLIPSASGGTITYDNSSLTFENVKMSTTATSGIETNGNNTSDAVTLKDSTLNVPNGFGIYFPSSGTLTIDNSTITAKTMGVQVCAGSLSISAGSAITVTGDAVAKTENDGAIQDGAAVSIINRSYPGGAPTATIAGGTFTSANGIVAVQAYTVSGTTASEWTDVAKYVNISGGTFSSAVPEGLCAEGYISVDNGDGTHIVKEGQYVAYVGSTKYESLAAAIGAAQDGDTVTLLKDIDLPATAVVKGKTITLDLNGKTISNSADIWDESKYAWSLISVRDNGDLTINDTAGGGTLKAKENDCYALDVQDKDTALTVNAGTYVGNISAIYAYDGKVTINGGHFSIQQKKDDGDPYRFTLNCYDANRADGTAKIIVNGGTFTNFDPRNNKAEGAGTSFVAEGVGVNSENGTFTAVPNMAAQIIAAGGGSVAAYAGHYDAIAAAKDGETVILLSDRKNYVTNTINANITIDLNGKTLSVGNNYPFFRTNGEVTIQNGTITSNSACVIVNAYNKLTLKNVKITGVTGNNGKNLVNVCSNAEVTIDKDTVLTASGSNGAAVFIGQDADAKYTLNVYGKVIRESKSFAISGNGSYKGTTTINIYDGAEVRSAIVAIYHPQAGVINVNGGLVEGYCAIGIKSGSLNIKGGTVRGTANDHILDDSNSTSGTIIYDGSAIVVDSYPNYKGDVNIKISGDALVQSSYSTAIREIGIAPDKTNVTGLSISGGTVLSGGGKAAVQVREVTKNNVSITGGSFSTDVAAYCATGYQCNVPTADEPLYTVTKKDADEIDVKRSLTLDNSLTMNYKVKLPTGYTSARVEFKFYYDYTKAFETATVTGVFNKSTGRYESAFTGINPQRMTDTLKATVYATNEDTQEETAFPVDDFSAAQYCNVLLASGYNKNGAYNELVGNLVAYGTAAQLYQKYHTDKLVSSVVTGGTVVQHPLADVAEVNELTAVTGGVSIEKKSLVLSNAFAIRVKFALEGDTTIDQVTFKVKADAKTATISQFEKETLSDGTVYYYFDFAGLNSKQLGSTVTFTAVVDGKDNDVLAFSANTYLKLMSNVAGVSTELKNLLAALYNYGYTCRNFKA